VLRNTSSIPMFGTGHTMSQVERKANECEDFHRPGAMLRMSSACNKTTVSAAQHSSAKRDHRQITFCWLRPMIAFSPRAG
jgi:hypothetical protein